MKFFQNMFVLMFTLCVTVTVTQAEPVQYLGAGKCKVCHKKADTGAQYQVWKKRKHSKAFESLGSEESKKIAAQLGIAKHPQESKECLICHVPALYDEQGKERDPGYFGKKFNKKDGVQCEDCHGSGAKYRKKKIMKKIANEGGVAKSPTAVKVGLLMPDEKTCRRCHSPEVTIGGVKYKNISFKEFDFEKRNKDILHPKPKK